MQVPHCTAGLTSAGTAQLGQSFPRDRLPDGWKQGKLKIEGKIVWLVGGKKRRKKENGRGFGGCHKRERGNSGGV